MTYRLYQGDCLDVLPTLTGVDAVVTDPPYGINDRPFAGGVRSGKRTGGDNVWHAASTWDGAIDPAWCTEVCRIAPVVAWFGHWRKREEVAQYMPHPLRAEIVWAKDCHMGPPCPVAMRDERIWLFSASGIEGRTFETSVWDMPIIPTWEFKHHKNEKPIALMARLVRFLTDVGATVLDPFMGSGSTGVAALREGRNFIGIEKDAAHYRTAQKRIANAQPPLFVADAPTVPSAEQATMFAGVFA